MLMSRSDDDASPEDPDDSADLGCLLDDDDDDSSRSQLALVDALVWGGDLRLALVDGSGAGP